MDNTICYTQVVYLYCPLKTGRLTMEDKKISVGFRLPAHLNAMLGMLAVQSNKTVTDVVTERLTATVEAEYNKLPEGLRAHYAAQVQKGQSADFAARMAIELHNMKVPAPDNDGLFKAPDTQGENAPTSNGKKK